MKSHTAIMLVAAAGNAALATAARESMTVEEGGVSFQIDRYDDGRSKPYRVVFTNPDDGVKSTFRFNTAGFVTNITPNGEPERYVIRYESNGDLDEVVSRSSGRRNLLSEKNEQEEGVEAEGEHASRRLYDCIDCIDAWDNVCDEGVPSVCELVGYGSPITAVGQAAISTVCETLGAACSGSGGEETCAGQCEDDGSGGRVLNACFDVTSDSYVCQPSDDLPNTLNLTPCAFTDDDVGDLPACFESFGKTNIETLWLSFHDAMTTLPVGVFSGLDNVVDMDLSYNGLQTLPVGALSGLSALVKLEVHWSSLESLPEGLFADVPKLDILRVTSSKLSSLPAGIFSPLTALRELRLSTDVSRFPDVNLQCLPSSTATDIAIFNAEDIYEGTCECQPTEAITCDAGTSCQPGTGGYTCE